MNETPNPSRLREYLLDRLPETEAAEIELALIGNDRSFELLAAVEEELIDDYVRNALTSAEARALLAYLERLPDGRERIRFGRALPDSSLARDPEATPLPEASPSGPRARGAPGPRRFALPAAAAALLLVSIVSGATILQLSHRIGELETELLGPEPTPGRVAAAPARVSFLLSSGTERASGSMQQVAVTGLDELVELRLDLAEDSRELYRATLHDVDGNDLLSMSRLAAQRGADQVLVPFLVPAAVLAPGDYYVDLESSGPSEERKALGRFDFRVTAR